MNNPIYEQIRKEWAEKFTYTTKHNFGTTYGIILDTKDLQPASKEQIMDFLLSKLDLAYRAGIQEAVEALPKEYNNKDAVRWNNMIKICRESIKSLIK